MARHSAPQYPFARRALLAVTTAGVALGAGAGTAAAAAGVVDVPRARPDSLGSVAPQAGLQTLTGTVGHVTGPVAGLKPNALSSPARASIRSTTAWAPGSATSGPSNRRT